MLKRMPVYCGDETYVTCIVAREHIIVLGDLSDEKLDLEMTHRIRGYLYAAAVFLFTTMRSLVVGRGGMPH